MKLEGRIVGLWTAELDRAWRSLGPSFDRKELSVDLCGVTYIDRTGRAILADIYRQTHAQFEADTPLTQYFADEVRAGSFEKSTKNGHGKSSEKGAQK